MLRPLQKTKENGELYKRRPSIKKLLNDWEKLSADQLVRQCQEKGDSTPTEALVYLLRHKDLLVDPIHFKTIFDTLILRITKILSSKVSDQVYDRAQGIREEILGEFIELIAMDRNEPDTKLDYYEVRFNHALESLRINYLRTVSPVDTRSVTLTIENDGVIDISPEVEEAIGKIVDPEYSEWSDSSFRSIVLSAINDLPTDQKLVIGLLLREMPIESADKNIMTISRALGCSDRTVRNRRNRAFETLRKKLIKEELL